MSRVIGEPFLLLLIAYKSSEWVCKTQSSADFLYSQKAES